MGVPCMVVCDDYRACCISHVKAMLRFPLIQNIDINLITMNSIVRLILLTVLISLLVTFIQSDLMAQCPMCKMSAEQNLKDGGTAGKGLNRGILYMLSVPYMLVGGLGLLWWKNRRRLSDEIYEQPYSDN